MMRRRKKKKVYIFLLPVHIYVEHVPSLKGRDSHEPLQGSIPLLYTMNVCLSDGQRHEVICRYILVIFLLHCKALMWSCFVFHASRNQY